MSGALWSQCHRRTEMRSPEHSLQVTLKTAAKSASVKSAARAGPSSCPHVCVTWCSLGVTPGSASLYLLGQACLTHRCDALEQSVFGVSSSPRLHYPPPCLLNIAFLSQVVAPPYPSSSPNMTLCWSPC